jgi:type II secretory pathway component PulL
MSARQTRAATTEKHYLPVCLCRHASSVNCCMPTAKTCGQQQQEIIVDVCLLVLLQWAIFGLSIADRKIPF